MPLIIIEFLTDVYTQITHIIRSFSKFNFIHFPHMKKRVNTQKLPNFSHL